MKHLFLILSLIIPLLCQAQNCNCESNFNWLKQTFEENDAGFSYALETKGKPAYDNHNEIFAQKAKSIKNSANCSQMLFEWLTFFRSGHIAIRNLGGGNNAATGSEPNDSEIIKQYEDWEKLEVDLSQFEKHLERKKEVDYEGIWESPPYKIGIRKQGQNYVGFIIEADGVYWAKGQVKLRINIEDNKISSVYYMRDHSPREFDEANILGRNYLQMGFITLKRLSPKFESDPTVEQYFKMISARKPFLEQLNDRTLLLRIPSFSHTEKKEIDSVILANKEKLLETENLIIDLRNNGGGSDGSYKGLLPFLYTNPIRTVGVELLSTPLNNQRMLDFINDPYYEFSEEGKKWAQESYDKLSARIGEFVNLDSTIVEIETYDTVYQYPQNIGIIIHENNGSTTEQFLLAAKQSKKVKLFGTTTQGVLDISNMYFVESPCAEFELGYSLSRSMRIPEMTIDDKGIQPDYYIDKHIPKYEWIEFVNEVLNGK